MFINSVLLMAARELMTRAGMKRDIVRAYAGGERYLDFKASNGRGAPKTLYLPMLDRTTRASILSLLEATGAYHRNWLCNGQAHKGTRQILHYGDSGACFVVFSRQVVASRLQEMYGAHIEEVMASDEYRQSQLRIAPERSRLLLRAPDDIKTEMIELPSEEVGLPIYRALAGELQFVPASLLEDTQAVIARGFALVTSPGPAGSDVFVLGRPDMLEHNREAA